MRPPQPYTYRRRTGVRFVTCDLSISLSIKDIVVLRRRLRLDVSHTLSQSSNTFNALESES